MYVGLHLIICISYFMQCEMLSRDSDTWPAKLQIKIFRMYQLCSVTILLPKRCQKNLCTQEREVLLGVLNLFCKRD